MISWNYEYEQSCDELCEECGVQRKAQMDHLCGWCRDEEEKREEARIKALAKPAVDAFISTFKRACGDEA